MANKLFLIEWNVDDSPWSSITTLASAVVVAPDAVAAKNINPTFRHWGLSGWADSPYSEELSITELGTANDSTPAGVVVLYAYHGED